MAINTYGDISQRTAVWASVVMLAHAEPVVVLTKYGMSKPMPKNKANKVKFRRPIPYTVSTSTLEEGVTPTSQNLRYEDVEATLSQYGAVTELTDVIQDLAEDPVLQDAMMLSGEQAQETLELVTWGVLKGGTSVFYADSADTSRSDVNSVITLNRQRSVTKYLKAQRGKKVSRVVSSSVKYGTEAIAPAYLAFGHTDLESDIRDLPGFTPTEKYASLDPLPYELGKVEDVRYILSPVLEPFLGAGSTTLNGMSSVGGTKVDVYPLVYVAREAYGCVPLKGEGSIEPKVLNPNQPSKSDPIGQRGYVGWKTYFTAVRLNEAWMSRAEVGATDLG